MREFMLKVWEFKLGVFIAALSSVLGAIALVYSFAATSSGLTVVESEEYFPPSGLTAGAYRPQLALCASNQIVIQRKIGGALVVGGPCPDGKQDPVAVVTWEHQWAFLVGLALMVVGGAWQLLIALDMRDRLIL